MWHSTSIDRKKTGAPSALRSRVAIVGRVVATCFAALLAIPPVVLANSTYPAIWSGVYPGKSAGCALCHATTAGGSSWNAYGYAIRQNAGATLAARIANVQFLNSDGNPANNLEEINANAQPG